MSARKKQSFLQGAMVLLVATVLVKVIGAFFKVPLTNIVGAVGMGYFNIAYGLFNTMYALSLAGFPVAVAKMVAESAAQGRYLDMRRIRRISTMAFVITGLVGSVLMFLGARPYVQFNSNPDALPAVLVMAPAIFFVCLTSSFRGYYEGLRNMYPTALSQVVEAVGKLVFGMLFATKIMDYGMQEYLRAGTVFGKAAQSLERARLDVLPYAAAGAIAGIVVSSLMGTLFLWLRHLFCGDGLTKAELTASPPATERKVLLRRLIRLAVPVCLGALVLNLTTLIDVSSITNRLALALSRDPVTVLQMYRGAIPPAMELTDVPNFLYGAYMMAVTVFNLVPAITVTIGVSALPVVASAWAQSNAVALRRNVESVLRVTALVAFPAGLGLFALSEPILKIIYPSEPAAAIIAGPMLRILGLAVLFVSFSSPVNSMLQAVGRVDVPVKLMLLGGSLKLLVNFVLIAHPGINIQVAPYGTLLCYASILLCSLPLLSRSAGIPIHVYRTFIKPLMAAALCGGSAWAANGMLLRVLGERSAAVLAMAIAALVYVASLFLLRVLVKEDVLMLPGGEKIAKTLEKHGLIG